VTVRAAGEGDIAAIAAIYRRAVATGTASWELVPPDETTMRERFRTLSGSGYPYLAALRGGALVGYAYASPFRPREGYRYTVEDSVYVAGEAQRSGVGRALLAALIDACAVGGWRQMVAVIGGAGEVASIRLHATQGFVEAGRLRDVGRKFGRWLDCVLMQRALGEGAATAPADE
jgi:phosphinothricin acetyltransferase